MTPLAQAIEMYTQKVTTVNNNLEQCIDDAKSLTNEVNASMNNTTYQCLALFTSSVESCLREPSADVFYSGKPVSLSIEVPNIQSELQSTISKGKLYWDRMQSRYNDLMKKVNRVAGRATFGGIQFNAIDNHSCVNRRRTKKLKVGVWICSTWDYINDLTTKLNNGFN
ncbi:hypothetical protein P9112_013409 [Eukaryota sp. TZLM1-RC]